MTNQAPKAFTIVAAIDYSQQSALVLGEAIARARQHECSHVHAVHVISLLPAPGPALGAVYVPPTVESLMEDGVSKLRSYVEKSLEGVSGNGKLSAMGLTAHVRLPHAAESIAQLAADLEADLVVVGTHGRRGIERLLLGSVAEAVVRLSPCPVLIVRPVGESSPDVPRIEPPCSQCIQARRATHGAELWCAQHREHHDRRHTYHFGAIHSGQQSGLLFPMHS
jgi:nucleotide-binding universal stress UspA family protein